MSGQTFRLAFGGRIDRSKPLNFTFNGSAYQGYAGDTLASALLANGVRLVGRSFKYHRPRGVVTAGPEEPNALVRIGRGARALPNLPATMVELYEGLEARSINCWPGVGFDCGAIIGLFARVLPAGFYYKTFMWPRGAWMWYEKFIRSAAGLGRTPTAPDPDRYEKRFDHCDVLVVGSGAAGIAAALAAGDAGARVLLVEERAQVGGQLTYGGGIIDGTAAAAWRRLARAKLVEMPEVRVLTRTTAVGYYDHNLVTLLERITDHLPPPPAGELRQRLWKVRARQVVVATGATERALVFANNDLPGVMLAGAAQRYAAQYGVRCGARAVVFANNDSAYTAALALADAGVEIAALIDLRAEPGTHAVRGLSVRAGQAVVAARGSRHVTGADIASLDPVTGLITGKIETVACDLICVSGGWDPAVHLFSQSGGRLAYDEVQHCFVPGAPAQPTHVAGAANGAFMLADCVAQGCAAGIAAARAAGFDGPAPAVAARSPLGLHPMWEIPAAGSAKKFVDQQNDVTAADLALAAREGYVSVEHAKRYTTTGMGVDQGKIGNITAFGILGNATSRSVPDVGTTTFRPPYVPVTIGALAGRDIGTLFEPVRKTPITDWHTAHGAVFEPVGLWRRPQYYARNGEDMHAAVARECLAVRNGIGLLDASTLGKIEIRGRDALKLLNMVYTNAWDSLAVGACRYGLMLREDGMVFDDGVTARLGENHYLMTTTSGGADGVVNWLEEWLQCEWLGWQVYVTPVTANWATLAVTGPQARTLLKQLDCNIDFAPAAFPHMAIRTGMVAGVPARIARVSFTAELSYEINVPARYGLALWETFMQKGAALGITPLGTEALHVLRAEKGFIVVGHDTDGTVTPHDLGMSWIVGKTKTDFLGMRGLQRSDSARAGRKQLVGLLTSDAQTVLVEGSQVIRPDDAQHINRPPVPMIGHVTSSYMSPTLGHSIALALIEDGRRRMNEEVAVFVHGRVVAARIIEPRFYDIKGERLNG
ncbi:MAG TPA: sarcosine oxidase subunit alpha family protein [Burkholderiales bacterium]|nr:sarcosine oxidase subunit alpha family protein [Burkholderiales bacterium]